MRRGRPREAGDPTVAERDPPAQGPGVLRGKDKERGGLSGPRRELIYLPAPQVDHRAESDLGRAPPSFLPTRSSLTPSVLRGSVRAAGGSNGENGGPPGLSPPGGAALRMTALSGRPTEGDVRSKECGELANGEPKMGPPGTQPGPKNPSNGTSQRRAVVQGPTSVGHEAPAWRRRPMSWVPRLLSSQRPVKDRARWARSAAPAHCLLHRRRAGRPGPSFRPALSSRRAPSRSRRSVPSGTARARGRSPGAVAAMRQDRCARPGAT